MLVGHAQLRGALEVLLLLVLVLALAVLAPVPALLVVDVELVLEDRVFVLVQVAE